jgi:hypothetical protein
MTWVLFVILYSSTGAQPVGVTSVPGYTLIDCQAARDEVNAKIRPRGYQIQTDCIPGPTLH